MVGIAAVKHVSVNVVGEIFDTCLRLRSIVMSMSVCVSICLSATISPEPHARSLPNFVHVSYVRGSVLVRRVDDRPHRLSAGRDDGIAQPKVKCNLRLPCFRAF